MTPIWFKGIVCLTQRVPEMPNFLIWNCYPADGEGGEPLPFRQILKKSNRDAKEFSEIYEACQKMHEGVTPDCEGCAVSNDYIIFQEKID